jgi:transcriptional regulator with XRE-family HTH domain
MNATETLHAGRRPVPRHVFELPLKDRMKWARTSAGLSHDRLVAAMGRSNRGHVIKIEQGKHAPGESLRDAWADATNVPRELFADEEDEESRPMHSIEEALLFSVRRLVNAELLSHRIQMTEPTASLAKATAGSNHHGG